MGLRRLLPALAAYGLLACSPSSENYGGVVVEEVPAASSPEKAGVLSPAGGSGYGR